jgi:DNA-binding MarR family transcriptional regulator
MEKERTKLTAKIIQLQKGMEQYTPQARMEISLTIAQLKCLLFIDYKETTNFNKLASALRVTPPIVTGIVDRIVRQGLVSREINPEHRRELLPEVNSKGKGLLGKLRESETDKMISILEHLNISDLSALAQGLAAVARATRQEHSEEERIYERN